MEQNCRSQSVRNVLVCFALRQEAVPFKRLIGPYPTVSILVTGMGLSNARRAVLDAIGKRHFDEVFSCGFAGGLKVGLTPGTVLFETENPALKDRLNKAGAIPCRFALAPRLLVTAAEKADFYKQTGADAAQFESEAVQAICREHNIPFAVVRVVFDAADEDLPVDFNEFMSATGRFRYVKFFWAVARAPGRARPFIELANRCKVTSEKLAVVLAAAMRL